MGAAIEVTLIRFADRYKENLKVVFNDEIDKLLATIGFSNELRQTVTSLMLEFNMLELDPYECALVSALCATSPDRGIQEQYAYKVLSTTQVIF